MQHDYKKVTQLVGWLLLVITVCFSINLIILSGSDSPDSASPVLAAASGNNSDTDPEQEKARLAELLSGLLLCGRWPVAIGSLSNDRGNPFEPKEIISQPLFFSDFLNPIMEQPGSCLTVREALNK